MKKLLTLILAFALLGACNDPDPEKHNNTFNNQTNNTNMEDCTNGIDDDGDNAVDCDDADCFTHPNCENSSNNTLEFTTIIGKVWSPGSDEAQVMAENKFPVPTALVAAYLSEPPPPTTGMYCNECVEIPTGVIHKFTEIDGSFELVLLPNTTYWIVVQKGEFRRVTMYTTGAANETADLEPPAGSPKPSMLTLPNKSNPSNGAWIPKILIIEGSYEDMTPLFSTLGFLYGSEVEVIQDTEADTIAGNMNELRKYNIIITTCGDDATFLTNQNIRDNLRQYVYEGGKLYVDDFSYDWAEQPFPEFLTFESDGSSSCGSGTTPPSSVGTCNHWSVYNPTGTPGDPYFELWLDVINPSGIIELEAAWDIISGLNANDQGECESEDPQCVNGHWIAPPKVWMYGTWSGYTNTPVTVSWNYYCGKVLYTVYHTHSGSGGEGYTYPLILQEKIMMYLIMEIQTCTKQNIVE
ncbi:hypothetical protein KKF34_04335 [Myxococcota bacterium]|nr:hypothetical protein [Myxococcota bacterium]MBU1382557.1 hypothetical protein [Myxococcota bacterium]MBU1496086.1 hypothetical protein [Myxococcota bacterium]